MAYALDKSDCLAHNENRRQGRDVKKGGYDVRVISGTARGTRLATLPGDDVTRPTVDRVKEGMFSAVQFLLEGARVLDLFSGSG